MKSNGPGVGIDDSTARPYVAWMSVTAIGPSRPGHRREHAAAYSRVRNNGAPADVEANRAGSWR